MLRIVNLNSSLVKAGFFVYFMTTTIYAVGHNAGFVLNVILREVLSINATFSIGVDRYMFFRADADTDYYRSSRPITDILNRYTCLV